ncbi:MAG TPA: helix-turn-helix transcriptional regulator [Candidatus Limnocylindrales bacterium]
MNELGRLLATLRRAAGLTRDQAAILGDCSVARIRALENGRATLEYLEGLRLAKGCLLCPQCFRREVEAALDRGSVVDGDSTEREQAGGEPVAI